MKYLIQAFILIQLTLLYSCGDSCVTCIKEGQSEIELCNDSDFRFLDLNGFELTFEESVVNFEDQGFNCE